MDFYFRAPSLENLGGEKNMGNGEICCTSGNVSLEWRTMAPERRTAVKVREQLLSWEYFPFTI